MTKREFLDIVFALAPNEANKIMDAFDEYVDGNEPHWIPVTEKLPEYGTAVLTYNRDEEFEINHIIDDEDGEWFYNGAIAWMPLPEPFKGVTDGKV